VEISLTALYDRTSLFCGSYNMVEKAEEFMHKAEIRSYQAPVKILMKAN
jgi:fructose-1,6-bisphosphatase I